MRGFTGVLLLVLLFVVLSFRQGIALYVDWLWFQEVGYTQLFTTTLFYKLILAVLSGGLLAALLYFNLKIAAVAPAGFRFSRVDNVIELPPPDLIDPLFRRLLLPAALFLGLLAAPQGAANWERLPLFLNATPFNLQDPLFGFDIDFYIFRLPMYSAAYQWLIFALALTLAGNRGRLFPLPWHSIRSSRTFSFRKSQNPLVDPDRPHSAFESGRLPVGLL